MTALSAASAPGRRLPVLLAWIALLALETLCQISLKLAGEATGAFAPNAASVLRALCTPWLWVAIGCYVGAFLAWMTILQKSALSAAFPTSAIAFVIVMTASWAVFGEPVGWAKALGSAIIVIGILLLGGGEADQPPRGNGHGADGRQP